MRSFLLVIFGFLISILLVQTVALDSKCKQTPFLNEPCGFTDIGKCRIGSTACDEKTGLVTCRGSVNPTSEGIIKNGEDEDCDGIVDQHAPRNCTTANVDCEPSTECLLAKCLDGKCVYVPRNVGLQCHGGGSRCLAPYKCTSRGQCLSASGISCSSHPARRDPRQDSSCVALQCIDGNCVPTEWLGPCDDGDPCTANDTCKIDVLSRRAICKGTPISSCEFTNTPVVGLGYKRSSELTASDDNTTAATGEDDGPSNTLIAIVLITAIGIILITITIAVLIFVCVSSRSQSATTDRKQQQPLIKDDIEADFPIPSSRRHSSSNSGTGNTKKKKSNNRKEKPLVAFH